MSNQQVRLASLLLQESFGELVEKVASFLMKHGSSSMTDVIKSTELKQNEVKKCLCVLIQHQLVSFELDKGGRALYTFSIPHVLLKVRFPRFIHAAKELCGDAGELVVEDILQHGQSLMSQCIERVSKRLEDDGVQHTDIGVVVKEQFVALVEGHFLHRVQQPSQDLANVSQDHEILVSSQRFQLPPSVDAICGGGRKRLRSESGEDKDTPAAKRVRGEESVEESGKPVDSGIYWYVNFDQFRQHFRNEAIVLAVKEKVDEVAACVMRSVLSLSSTVPAVFVGQIEEAMPERPMLSHAELELYLKALVDDQVCFLRKTGDSGGGSYAVNFKNMSEMLCKSAIESVVRERFGSKCFRVFRLLLLKKILEQKQVSDMAMISSREAKELLYTLVAENFVSIQEIPRTPDYAPSRTFYLFSVNVLHVARMVLERTYKALGNLIARRMLVARENKRLLEKFHLYECQQRELQGEGGDEEGEIEEILTPDEKEKVERVKRSIAKLHP